MPSPDARSVDLPIQVLGGRVTQFDPQALPQGASPFNRDVIFSGANAGGEVSVGGVGSRPGMQSLYAAFFGNPAINYIRTFVDSSGNPHQLFLDSLGVVRDDFPEATFTSLATIVANAFAQSDTYAGREWLAIGDGKYGIDIPRQYDGTNFDRVSQVGPALAPDATDENFSANIFASPSGAFNMGATPSMAINAISEVGNLVTVVFASGFAANQGLPQVGDQFTIAGVGVAGYNGTFTVAKAVDFQTIQYVNPTSGLANSNGGTILFFYGLLVLTAAIPAQNALTPGMKVVIAGVGVAGYNGTWPVVNIAGAGVDIWVNINQTGLANSGNGTLTPAGNITAGLRQVSVAFVTRQNQILCPAPPSSWTAAGAKRVQLSDIAKGPSNINQRIVIFTPTITSPAITGPFFYFPGAVSTPSAGTFPSMVIGDNITTTAIFDFLDAVLQTGTAASNLFNLLELGECSSTISYSERTFWVGERNKVNAAGGGGGFNNLTFDGGFPYNGQQFQTPFGWTNDSTAGGRTGVAGGPPSSVWGDGLAITGDGATAVPARIYQTAFQDYLGVPIIKAGVGYSVRVRLICTQQGGRTGTFHIRLNSPSQGVAGAGLAVALSAIPAASFNSALQTEFTAVLVLATQYPNTAALPSDLRLEVYVDGTPGNGVQVIADCIEPYPTLNAINRTLVRASYAFTPEAFDGVTGQLIVGKDNGQAAKCLFKLLDKKLYIVKERSLYGTQDDGANEPSLWALDPISGTVGTPSVHGIDVAGESWAVIAAHDGLYIFWGAQPVKISQEIQPDWDTINWNAGQNLWVVVDSQNKRVHVGVPTGASTIPNQEFVMDYSQLNDAEDIAASPQAHYAYFNPSNIVAPGRARKWSVWNLSNNSAALTLRADGSYHLLRGNAAGNGKIYDQVATQTSDDGVAINAMYQTYYFPNGEEEVQLQQIIGGHRRLFKFLTGYAFGSGVMTWSAHGQQDNRIVALSNLTLKNPASNDFEKNVNFPSERASLLFGTNAIGAWFHLSKVKPTITKDTMLVRGVA